MTPDNREEQVRCTWQREDSPESDCWATGCGNYFTLNDGTPTDNELRFCCYCGKPLHEAPYESEEDDGR